MIDKIQFAQVLVGTVLVLVFYYLLNGAIKKTVLYPYTKIKQLLTPAEQKFFKYLRKAVGHDFLILAKVRIADVVTVSDACAKSIYWKAFNKISAKHLDFVLCNKSSTDIILAIELDDSSHLRKDRRERDVFVTNVCAAAGLPLVRFKTQNYYLEHQIAHDINKALKIAD